MDIKILGTGCAKCKTLESLTREAVQQSNLKAEVTKVEDIVEIMKYGVLATPALVVDEKVMSMGKSLTIDEIKNILIPQ